MKTCFAAFAHTSMMLFNVWSGNILYIFWRICTYFQTIRIKFFLKIFFNVWSGFKRVLMHLRILPDQKTCFGAFAHTFRPQETWAQKWCYLTSEVVMYVFWCIYAYFQTTRIKFLKRYFLMYGVVINVFLRICAYFQTTRIKFLKKIFFNVWCG